MAILNQHLVPLIELLTELGIDWLAFELIEGIRRGEEPLEDERTLALARYRAGTQHREETVEHAWAAYEPQPIPDVSQSEWAARYVFDRLGATLAEMTHSLDVLDEIVDDRNVKQPPGSRSSAVLVLLDGGEECAVGRARIEAAQARLPELREALDAWVVRARSEERE
ncbi:MAG: hypothetical protein OXC19_23260 [Bryobacterales bacterium]|nr:hypothetical protein [Bryobacterales bacterium]